MDLPIVAPEPAPSLEPLDRPPTFAIVITAYEVADQIGAAVESALAQTHPADEVIVVDDGSTDDLAGALARFGDRIAVVRKENGGGASARNEGVRACKSEFMAILDADDVYHPRRLEVLAELARRRPDLDLITTDARYLVDGEGVGTYREQNGFPSTGQRQAIFENCYPGGWPALRVSALDSAGGFDESFRIAYDWECWLRMLLNGSGAGLVDLPFYDYVLHQGSLASNRPASLAERARLLEKAATNPNLDAEERPALARELRRRRQGAARAAIEASLYGNAEHTALLRVATARGTPPMSRGIAALAFLLPPLGRRLVPAEAPPEQRLAGKPSPR